MTLKVIHLLQAFSNAICQKSVQQFTQFQLALCSQGSCVLAELPVGVQSGFTSWCMQTRLQVSVYSPCHLLTPRQTAGCLISSVSWQLFVCAVRSKYTSKTANIIFSWVHLLYYAYNITYEYHDKVVVNLHASNVNATIFLRLRTTTYMVHWRCNFDYSK